MPDVQYTLHIQYHLNVKVEKKLLMIDLKEMHFLAMPVGAVNVVVLSESTNTLTLHISYARYNS